VSIPSARADPLHPRAALPHADDADASPRQRLPRSRDRTQQRRPHILRHRFRIRSGCPRERNPLPIQPAAIHVIQARRRRRDEPDRLPSRSPASTRVTDRTSKRIRVAHGGGVGFRSSRHSSVRLRPPGSARSIAGNVLVRYDFDHSRPLPGTALNLAVDSVPSL
jgi:hypothetical protein